MRPRTGKLLVSIGALSGLAGLNYFKESKVYASWTSHYEPSPCAKWDENWDHRSPHFILNKKAKYSERSQPNSEENVQKYTPTACRHLILIRHGQYNLEGLNDEERYLTKLGRIQADYTGKRLIELGLPYTNMIKSTMTRAQETGTIISNSLPNLPVTNCELLREGAPIPPEPPLYNYNPQTYQFYEDGARIEAAFRKYFHRAEPDQKEDSYHVIVCHANVIRYLVCRALQVPAEAWLRFSLNHASITWISITPNGRCVLRTMGDTGYMPPNVITAS